MAETNPFPGPCDEVVVALEISMLLAGAVTEQSGADSAHGGPWLGRIKNWRAKRKILPWRQCTTTSHVQVVGHGVDRKNLNGSSYRFLQAWTHPKRGIVSGVALRTLRCGVYLLTKLEASGARTSNVLPRLRRGAFFLWNGPNGSGATFLGTNCGLMGNLDPVQVERVLWRGVLHRRCGPSSSYHGLPLDS